MTPSSSPIHKLEDYKPNPWLTPRVNLRFDLDLHLTVVRADYEVVLNGNQIEPLFLHGESVDFLSIRIDGAILDPNDYQVTSLGILIPDPPKKEFRLTVENGINPAKNTSLEGLYKSGSMLCTQNEPEGFRKIIYSIDRPDNMMRFRVTISGDKTLFPVMLSNGNLVGENQLVDGKREVIWEDPYPKPSYLFALVAGELEETKDSFVTKSGREITLKIFVEKGNEEKVGFAFDSLKKAMKWDEDTFGLEYDLDLFMIVAVEDFNMGAMENKGLNLFNAKLVLADKKSATDESFEAILAVIAHEYFHNWTGNRVTLRNWFNLTLKEGLTVFRDQWFTEDMTDPAVKRIKDVLFLKEYQFPEDQGPMSHPILPKSYKEMNNFYTVTVYEKGAEVIRLVSELIGRENFKKGLKHYLSKYDGQGVTFEEFVSSMEEVVGHSIPNLRNWYHRSGTPVISVKESYVKDSNEWIIDLVDAGSNKYPLVYSNSLAIFNREGSLLKEEKRIMTGERDQIRLSALDGNGTKPIVSFFRSLSSPVRLEYSQSEEETKILAKMETDGVTRFFAFQNLIFDWFRKSLVSDQEENFDPILDTIRDSFGRGWDKTYHSFYLSFPGLTQISESLGCYEYVKLSHLRTSAVQKISTHFTNQFQLLFEENRKTIPVQTKEEIGKRRLKNICLYYLLYDPGKKFEKLAVMEQREAKHMSEEVSPLKFLLEVNSKEQENAVSLFFEKWKHDGLVLDVWFAAQVASGEDRSKVAEKLENHPQFNIRNPNKVRSLYFSLARNPLSFHKEDGSGYRFIAERIKRLNEINPQMAAALTKLFSPVSKQKGELPKIAKKELESIATLPNLSKELGEVVGTILNSL
ncbi:aminopeptidase N [Leptospira congkakensis]|uniref:Aminopeptidase N n=1 Tax=Leptospira congkakensis TaxID=2484932 RepID=A0A4Z1AKV6_9LEPT|nr:aminopeptidase N [Leptospira congkakensis]TGL90358.1 aminopeptidase N [Leptospira congkakensis]TGL91365.1 aminopeptidase N [Leptospira congkakensis]TGL98417.1 aminopeptidase N [Leptospira congkakensis]